LVTFDILKHWEENGIIQVPDDIYNADRFAFNDEQRLMLKFEKKGKIIDLLTKVRRKRKIKSVKELNVYRVNFSKRDQLYQFSLVSPDDYNTDIFGGSGNKTKSHATFYLCSNTDPLKTLLATYTGD